MARAINDLFVLFLLVAVPAMSFFTARQDEILLLPRKSLYFSAALSQWLLSLLTAIVAFLTSAEIAGFRPAGWGTEIRWTAGLAGAACIGIGMGLLLEAMGWWSDDGPLLRKLIPVTRSEKLWALFVVAPTAAICEEFVYRAYLLPQLSQQFHSIAIGWAVSSIAFGLCHAYQKAGGMARAALLGALLAAPVVITGSIYPAIVIHFLIDAAGLLWIGPVSLKREQQGQTQTL